MGSRRTQGRRSFAGYEAYDPPVAYAEAGDFSTALNPFRRHQVAIFRISRAAISATGRLCAASKELPS